MTLGLQISPSLEVTLWSRLPDQPCPQPFPTCVLLWCCPPSGSQMLPGPYSPLCFYTCCSHFPECPSLYMLLQAPPNAYSFSMLIANDVSSGEPSLHRLSTALSMGMSASQLHSSSPRATWVHFYPIPLLKCSQMGMQLVFAK